MELGGGRHNEFVNNIINGSGTIHFDARGGGGLRCVVKGRMPYVFLEKRTSFAPLHTTNDHFIKTGSGQTQGKLKMRCVF
jgi:hypothetical protein